MITLYHGSGAQDFQVLDDVMPVEKWAQLRSVAVRLLRANGHSRAAEILEKTPFALREGTNGFSDEFSILYWSAPLESYVKAAEWSENQADRLPFAQIAKAVSKLATTNYVRFIAVDIRASDSVAAVENPSLAITVDVVERALRDAEQLIAGSGATSGIDRIHTALHGYLRAMCEKAKIACASDASVTELFKLLRKGHPLFSTVSSDGPRRVLTSFATIVDALDPVRNHSSMAHPNKQLLDEPEAMLVINAARTLMHYLNAKEQAGF